MKSIKNLIAMGLWTLGMLLGNVAMKACPPGEPCDTNNDDPTGGANDPVFFFSEGQPATGVKEKLGQLRQQVVSRKSTTGEQDQAALQAYEAARKDNPKGIYDKTLDIWSQTVSPDLKQYVVLSSLTAVKTTEQVETLRFMLASLNDLPAQTGQLADLSKGNGLEKAKAARLMGILSQNPQFKL